MAEFCVECWSKLNEATLEEKDYVLSKEKDLCEGCGKYKQVIVRMRGKNRLRGFFTKRRKKN